MSDDEIEQLKKEIDSFKLKPFESKEGFEQRIKLVREIIAHRKENPYFHSSLPEYFQYDTWYPEEALLLLAGLSPKFSKISIRKTASETGIVKQYVNLIEIQPLHVDYDMYDLPDEVFDSESIFGPGVNIELDSETVQRIEDKKHMRVYFERRFNDIKKKWDSGIHTEERYPPSYYIEWAKSKKIKIYWLGWAKAQGLVESIETGSSNQHCWQDGRVQSENAKKREENEKPSRDKFWDSLMLECDKSRRSNPDLTESSVAIAVHKRLMLDNPEMLRHPTRNTQVSVRTIRKHLADKRESEN